MVPHFFTDAHRRMISPASALPAAFCCSLLVLVTAAKSAVLISDNFGSVGSGSNIDERTPSFVDPSLGAIQWEATTANFYGNGSGGLTVTQSSTANRSVGIDLGSATYFSTNAGVHEISLDIQGLTGLGSASWVGFGFTSVFDVAVNQTQTGSAGKPWMLNRLSGSTVVYQGAGATNSFPNTVSTVDGSLNTFVLRLDTSAANWTLEAFINGTPMDLDGSVGGSTKFTYGTNPSDLRYLAISTGFNTDTGTMLVDNFSYSFEPVPEPSVAILSGVAGLFLLRRRR